MRTLRSELQMLSEFREHRLTREERELVEVCSEALGWPSKIAPFLDARNWVPGRARPALICTSRARADTVTGSSCGGHLEI